MIVVDVLRVITNIIFECQEEMTNILFTSGGDD